MAGMDRAVCIASTFQYHQARPSVGRERGCTLNGLFRFWVHSNPKRERGSRGVKALLPR